VDICDKGLAISYGPRCDELEIPLKNEFTFLRNLAVRLDVPRVKPLSAFTQSAKPIEDITKQSATASRR
jgi:hypothetical protein